MMLLVVMLFGYGVIFGSFINALVWRLREQGRGQRAEGKASRYYEGEVCVQIAIIHWRQKT